MAYTINANAKNVWIRDNEDTRDLSIQTDASSVYLDNGRTLEQELGEGSMVSNVTTVDSAMSKVIDGTLDGVYESGVMYGRSLVNLITNATRQGVNMTSSYDDSTKTWNISSGASWGKLGFVIQGKPNTKYYFLCKDKHSSVEFYFRSGDSIHSNVATTITKINDYSYTFVTYPETGTFMITFELPSNTANCYVTQPMIIEYQEGMEDWDIPYFEGLCDSKMPILHNVSSEAFCHDSLEGGTISGSGGGNASSTTPRARTKDMKKLNGATSILFSDNLLGVEKYVFSYDSNKRYLGRTPTNWETGNEIKPVEGAYYYRVVFTKYLEELPHSMYIIPKNHKTNILHTPETVTLRSLPNGVRDELNLKTGEYTKRIGEILFDGSDDETWSYANGTNVYVVEVEDGKIDTDAYIIATNSDTIPSETRQNVWNALKDGVALHKSSASGRLLLYKNSINTLNALKLHLQSNPLTVQYELQTPITTKVALTQSEPIVKIGTELPNGVCDTYNLLTGEHIQRVGKVVLDGSEVWKNGSLTSNDGQYYVSYCPLSSMKKYTIASGVISLTSDKFVAESPVGDDEAKRRNREFIASYGSNATVVDGESNWIYLSVEKGKIANNTGTAFANYLKSNPVTVWYELKNPIVTKKNGLPNTYGVTLPNGEADKYNESTGVYTQNLGKVVLDGSQDLQIIVPSSGLTYFVYTTTTALNQDTRNNIVSNLPISATGVVDTIVGRANGTGFNITLGDQTIDSVDKAKSYLASNPVYVYYPLATPKTIDIPLINVGQVLPNGVCDTYNPITKEYVKRVSRGVLDGTEENWILANNELTNTVRFATLNKPPFPDAKVLGSIISNLHFGNELSYENDKELIEINSGKDVVIRISRARLSSPDLDGFKKWIKKNPLTVWYELENPTTSTVDLDLSTLYSSSPIAYENGHVILESGHNGQSLLPTLEYSTITNRVKQIESIGEQVLRQEKQLTMLEQMLIQNIIGLDYNNTVLALNLEINEVM